MDVPRLQVESLDQFRIMAQRPLDAYIVLGDGAAQSYGRHWWMYESIGDSERYYTERQFASSTSIVEAIGKAALYVELDPDR